MSESQPPQRKSIVMQALTGDAPRPGDDSAVRRAGRSLIFAMHGALRSIKLYPIENAAVQKALGEVASQVGDLLKSEGELEIRVSGEFIFVNSTRLRLGPRELRQLQSPAVPPSRLRCRRHSRRRGRREAGLDGLSVIAPGVG